LHLSRQKQNGGLFYDGRSTRMNIALICDCSSAWVGGQQAGFMMGHSIFLFLSNKRTAHDTI